ncbi:MAG: glycosyltransferase, partial [Pseudomonadota bacterium]
MSNAATFIIAAWNAEDLLGRSVDSALQQQGVDTQVIVANDASTDGTSAVARSLTGVQSVVDDDAAVRDAISQTLELA